MLTLADWGTPGTCPLVKIHFHADYGKKNSSNGWRPSVGFAPPCLGNHASATGQS